jgi:hypothetical protein
MPLKPCTSALLSVLATLALSAPAAAQRLSVTPSPGLWESTQKMLLNGVDAMAAMRTAQAEMLKSLPPADRAMAEQMMKAQAGAFGGPQRECLTAQAVRELNDPALLLAHLNKQSAEEGDACRHQVVSVSGNTIQVRSQCKPQEGWQGTMQGTLTLHDERRMSHRFTGSGKLVGEAMPGIPNPTGTVNIVVEGQGRWLGAACGDVKPGR